MASNGKAVFANLAERYAAGKLSYGQKINALLESINLRGVSHPIFSTGGLNQSGADPLSAARNLNLLNEIKNADKNIRTTTGGTTEKAEKGFSFLSYLKNKFFVEHIDEAKFGGVRTVNVEKDIIKFETPSLSFDDAGAIIEGNRVKQIIASPLEITRFGKKFDSQKPGVFRLFSSNPGKYGDYELNCALARTYMNKNAKTAEDFSDAEFANYLGALHVLTTNGFKRYGSRMGTYPGADRIMIYKSLGEPGNESAIVRFISSNKTTKKLLQDHLKTLRRQDKIEAGSIVSASPKFAVADKWANRAVENKGYWVKSTRDLNIDGVDPTRFAIVEGKERAYIAYSMPNAFQLQKLRSSMNSAHKQVLEKLKTKNQNEIIKAVADYYQQAATSHLFVNGNNSVFMNQANGFLRQIDKSIPHLELDMMANVMSKDRFSILFKDVVLYPKKYL